MSARLTVPTGTRETWACVVEGLIGLCHGAGELVTHTERPWTSATFSGVRHVVTLRFDVAGMAPAGKLGTRLGTDELKVPGYLVADASVIERDYHQADGLQRLDLTVAVLLLDLDPPSSW